jgi:release factor glutamine methyltransferase
VVANLPYVPEADRVTLAKELAHDPALALFGGADGMEVIRRFVPEAARRLLPGGWLALEIGIDQAAETESLLRAAGLIDIRTIKDISGVARFPVARRA